MKTLEFNFDPEQGRAYIDSGKGKGTYRNIDLSIGITCNETNPEPINIQFESPEMEEYISAGLSIEQAEEMIDSLKIMVEFAKNCDLQKISDELETSKKLKALSEKVLKLMQK